MDFPVFQIAFLSVNVLLALLFVWFAVVSVREKEYRAAAWSVVLFVLFGLISAWGTVWFFSFPEVKTMIVCVVAVIGVLLVLPFDRIKQKQVKALFDLPRFDERDIMFSRMRLEPGTERYKAYYSVHREKEILDNQFRNKPGLMQKGSSFYRKGMMAAADANFQVVDLLHPLVEGKPVPEKEAGAAEQFTTFLSAWAKKIGAKDVGITALKPYHLYSHIGRGAKYGETVTLNHEYAIAFTVEMDLEMISFAPKAPIVMESSHQYLRAGAIAVQLAQWIRDMGYEARAHIDGNYRVVCPLVARDAGLGEIGRMGLLMTPRLGPRVRLGIVTTTMPLVPASRRNEDSVESFCKICKKCAAVCPSQSIPKEDQKIINGIKRWQINSESCFTYWCTAGTDCGRCMRVCPYSHPDHPLHNLVRWGIRQNQLFRHFALLFDDFLYGKKPAVKKIPKEMDF